MNYVTCADSIVFIPAVRNRNSHNHDPTTRHVILYLTTLLLTTTNKTIDKLSALKIIVCTYPSLPPIHRTSNETSGEQREEALTYPVLDPLRAHCPHHCSPLSAL